MLSTLISLLITLFTLGASAQNDGWILEETKEEVEIYSKVDEETGRKWIRLSTIIPSNFKSVVDYTSDVTKLPEWVYACKETELYSDSDTETLYCSVTDMPFPMSERYTLIRKSKYVDTLTGVYKTVSEDYKEKTIDSEYVRVSDFQAIWRFEDAGSNSTRVTYDLFTSVDLPGWLEDKVKRYGPYRTLLTLKDKFKYELH